MGIDFWKTSTGTSSAGLATTAELATWGPPTHRNKFDIKCFEERISHGWTSSGGVGHGASTAGTWKIELDRGIHIYISTGESELFSIGTSGKEDSTSTTPDWSSGAWTQNQNSI